MSWIRMLAVLAFVCQGAFARDARQPLFFVKAQAKNQAERSRIADAGIAIDGVLSDAVAFVGTEREIAKLKAMGIPLEVTSLPKEAYGFPNADAAYHDHAETLAA